MDYGFASDQAVLEFRATTLTKARDKLFNLRSLFYENALLDAALDLYHHSIMLYIRPTILLRGVGLPVEGNMTIAE